MDTTPEEDRAPVPARKPIVWLEGLAGTLIVLLSIAYAGDIHRYVGLSIYDAQLLAAGLTLALTTGFLAIARRATGQMLCVLALIAAAVTFGAGAYLSFDYITITMEAPYLPMWLVFLSGAFLGALLLNIVPSVGYGILVVVLVFIGYGLFGHLMPGAFRSRETLPSELLIYLATDANGMLGTALKVAIVIVVPYLLFGKLLSACGAASFFNDGALALMGRFRGGPAKVAVTASSLFGSISGNAVGNVVGTGVVTIPMMKRAGFQPAYAGAVEATASTGGQLVPPVMGAAAFIMADMIQVDYVNIMLAALPAAILYYVAIFINVDLRAGKRNLLAVPREEIPSGWGALKAGWHFVIPFAVLFYALFALNMRPERAAVIATVVLLFASFVIGYKGDRMKLRDLLPLIADTGRSALDLIIVCAAAGIIIGVLNISGLAFNLTMNIVAASGSNVAVLAVITALISVVLGMGMPTVGVYILLATLVAPALVEVGVPVIAAHLFVFYFGLLSMITPPVALASFAAANIAGASAWTTSMEAMKIAWPAYIVPFLFISTPALTFDGTWTQVIWTLATAILGIYMVTAAIVGFFRRSLNMGERVTIGIAGVLALLPASLLPGFIWTDVIGLIAFCGIYALIRPYPGREDPRHVGQHP
ncbi:TRAP transporter fused permease subunit [Chelativorans sp. AA-79]|uniref:TRAP transporter permease n=1 Tax=Chelativorans sp. AA-79 TaxID=3028735 RepID=UPI0023F7E13A|nr:TRAP transporter fused permease subunit [Chelativorans sp. AA-79]WEX10888.1 TRAP transporter fused permease subunit [Chelativorans sp. AA-79]